MYVRLVEPIWIVRLVLPAGSGVPEQALDVPPVPVMVAGPPRWPPAAGVPPEPVAPALPLLPPAARPPDPGAQFTPVARPPEPGEVGPPEAPTVPPEAPTVPPVAPAVPPVAPPSKPLPPDADTPPLPVLPPLEEPPLLAPPVAEVPPVAVLPPVPLPLPPVPPPLADWPHPQDPRAKPARQVMVTSRVMKRSSFRATIGASVLGWAAAAVARGQEIRTRIRGEEPERSF